MKTAACAKNIIDTVFLCLLGGLILGYAVFSSTFAEMALFLPFLPFPIFIGEIALTLCIIWGMAQVLTSAPGKKDLNQVQLAVILFSAWILMKAFAGYFGYGPLSFRNAALYYYCWFAVLTYFFAVDKKLSVFPNILFFCALYISLVLNIIGGYFLWFGIAVMVALIVHVKNERLRSAGILLLVILAIFKFRAFFLGSRSHMVSMLAVFVFLYFTSMVILWSRSKGWVKIAMSGLVVLGLWGGVMKFSDRNQWTSIITPAEVIKLYNERIAFIKAREAQYEPPELAPQLYHPNVAPNESVDSMKSTLNAKVEEIKTTVAPAKPAKMKDYDEADKIGAPVVLEEEIAVEEEAPMRNLDNAYGNIIFRLLVWRDMIVELSRGNWLWGVNFGKPQRSHSLEICRWAMTEWQRDGWITPHNSFLHMVYRGGIIGALFALFILGCVIKLTRDFIQRGSFAGLFLVSALIYWIVLSQFLVILELPYIAVPFWILMGMTLVYDHQLKRTTVENTARS